jgi:hypothetical protein
LAKQPPILTQSTKEAAQTAQYSLVRQEMFKKTHKEERAGMVTTDKSK